MIKVIDSLAEVVFKIVGYVMQLAPFAVLGAMTGVVALKGLGILYFVCVPDYLLFRRSYFLCFWGIVGHLFGDADSLSQAAGARQRLHDSDVQYGKLGGIFAPANHRAGKIRLQQAYHWLCASVGLFIQPRRLHDVHDLCHRVHCTGLRHTAFYRTADAMLPTLMITSKGIAGVPRASLVVIAGTLAQFDLPVEGLALLIGVDPFFDMGRSATSVAGNAVATAVISKLEGEYIEKLKASIF